MSTVKKTPFELQGADAAPLRGEVRTSGRGEDRPAVIICHGFKGFKDWGFFPHLAEHLARAGMTAVSFNFSGSGVGPDGESFSEPERFGHSTFSRDLEDIGAVCRALKEGRLVDGVAPSATYSLFGHSRGGGTAILHAADNSSVRAVVTWAAIAEPLRWDEATVAQWRTDGKMDIVNQRTGDILPLYTDVLDDIEQRRDALDIVSAAARVRAPWLIIHGDADESVPPEDAQRLYRAANKAMVEIVVVSGGSHTFGARHPWDGFTAELETAMEGAIGWFSRHLL